MSFLWIFPSASNLGVYSILPLYLVKERGSTIILRTISWEFPVPAVHCPHCGRILNRSLWIPEDAEVEHPLLRD